MQKEKYLPYFEEICREDEEHVLTICEVASACIYDKFRLRLDDPKLLAAIWSKIFDAILIKLEKLENNYSDFTINVCDRVSFGYSTNVDEEDEKQGNFMVFITHMNNNKKTEESEDPRSKPEERAMQWNTENLIEQPKLLAEISVDSLELLKSIDVYLGSREYIMPIFCMVYEQLVNYLMTKRKELNEYEFEINFISCFFIGARETDDGIDEIFIRPNIESKLRLKSDSKASSQYE